MLAAIAAGPALAAIPGPLQVAWAEVAKPAADADPLFQEPYVDVEEWRDLPVRHLYVHGGFKNTDTRFSLYLPPKAKYQGRFFQHIAPIPDSETLAQRDPVGAGNRIGFAIASGGYFVETNGGGAFDLGRNAMGGDPTIAAYRANAAAARYSREVAGRIYGTKRRIYGYAFGGSGGAYRTIGASLNTEGAWDGFVPYVMGSENAVPSVFSVRMQVQRLLQDKFPQVIDAMEPGGSGDPYGSLNDEQKAAFREAVRFGIPPQSWFGYKTMGVQGFIAIYQVLLGVDPGYFTDFWTKPGYLGFDPPASLKAGRIQFPTKIAGVLTDAETENLEPPQIFQRGGVDSAFKPDKTTAFRLAGAPPQVNFLGGDLMVKTGMAAGERISLKLLKGDVVAVGVANPDIVAKIKPGDEVVVDNSSFLAAQTYHRHQVPDGDFTAYEAWEQFRGPGGKPLYPQRPFLLGPGVAGSTVGSPMTGKIHGKMIVLQSLWDRDSPAWQADWWRKRVEKALGDKAGDSFRLYYNDHALHGDERGNEDPSRIVEYVPILEQALRDLAAWVERGVAPPQSTAYSIVDGQTKVAAAAAARKGLQPVVTLSANGAVRAEVKVGEPVRFSALAEVPPGGGSVVGLGWDFAGKGAYAPALVKPGHKVELSATHAFDRPGTYFVGVRVTAQREPGPEPYARMQNIDRVRVVVR